ncbi:MAG: hypothetical protein H6819_10900 [Phycisphaerales bacterium]|nr:hypothetical protein [Phycisphaerales bacterium]MCB9855607.1 hypothetical protein [Phycisphaerales bacterium]MCB9864904.1 hypothetical protein [Phycisphaerales bacterium]
MIRAYALQHVKADEAARTIVQLMGIDVVPDSRTNTLIISATEVQAEEVAKIISKIDIPRDDSLDRSTLTTVSIHNREVHDVAAQVSEMFRRDLVVSADERSRQILLRGDAEMIESALRVISSIDTAMPTATVEFAYFQVGSTDTDFSMETPKDLLPIAQQIERFGRPRLVGRMMTAAVEGQVFSLKGQIAERTFVNLTGRLIAAPVDGAVKLELTSDLSMRRMTTDDDQQKVEVPRFSLSTTVMTKRGDYIVLGSAPLGWAPGESVVLVVQVNNSTK